MNIRNFSIIAHIDHGKSTLADRMLERTSTIAKRQMRDQVLDSMELERERGITIKMQPVRMRYTHSNGSGPEQEFIFNLIDTPGHIDFAYEVSRALKAVEGALLLVDATQGVQAQTLSTLSLAREQGLTIVPVLSKVDSQLARVEEVRDEIVELIDCDPEDVLLTSGKTGEGVDALLEHIIERIPAPEESSARPEDFRGLVFDFEYSNHRGIIVYVRVFDGAVTKGDSLLFCAADKKLSAQEVGTFGPAETPAESLGVGEIGYIVTGIKQPGIASVGDTLASAKGTKEPLSGYQVPRPVVWASVYPESQDDFTELRQALGRLQLSDSSLSFEEETSGTLGRGFRCGFLGMLHLEIVTERLKREFGLTLVVTSPTIVYQLEYADGSVEEVYSPAKFPDDGAVARIYEPWITATIVAPPEHVGSILQLLHDHEAELGDSETFKDGRTRLTVRMPLRELMRGFFDRLKSVTSGFGSLSYDIDEMRPADVTRLDVLVAEEPVPAFSRVIARRRADEEARQTVERLYELLPKQLFPTKIQAKALGRIIASKTLPAMRKDVTGHLYGGDVTRKRKLLEKQKKGKKKLESRGSVNIPHDVFLKMMKSGE